MKEFSKALRAKGYTLAGLASRWDLSKVRLGQISTNPTQLHLDALAGLPGDPDDPHNLDDFEDLLAAGKVSDLVALLFSAMAKHKWSDQQCNDLAEQLAKSLQASREIRKFNNRRKKLR